MRHWGYSARADELAQVAEAAGAFRKHWTAIRPPFDARFDGGLDDIRALDYLEYEGIGYGHCGLEQAALVCGEVVRRAARLEWVISYRGEWLVATHEGRSPSFAFCPLARLHEAECGAGPQFGKHAWVVEQAALGCFLAADAEAEPDIRRLLESGHDDRALLERTLDALRRSGRST